jgi:hypothetical protein
MTNTTADDDMELCASHAALDACLQQIAEACPRMVAVAWIIDGDLGSMCAVRETNSKVLMVSATVRERLKTLAAKIEGLPEVLRTVVELEMDLIRSSRTTRSAELPQDASPVKC